MRSVDSDGLDRGSTPKEPPQLDGRPERSDTVDIVDEDGCDSTVTDYSSSNKRKVAGGWSRSSTKSMSSSSFNVEDLGLR